MHRVHNAIFLLITVTTVTSATSVILMRIYCFRFYFLLVTVIICRRWYAPTPPIGRRVAHGSMSVTDRTACPTQSMAACVDNANWNGAHTASTSLLNCFARDLPINPRKMVPVATLLTPPSFFWPAVTIGKVSCRNAYK